MAKVKNYDSAGKPAGERELSGELWDGGVNLRTVHATVQWQRASRRAGTHKVKTRAEVSGSGKKPYKQKGTGNARQGATRAVQFRHGGRAWGPSPRDYGYALPHKVRRTALVSALRQRAAEGMIAVYEPAAAAKPSTKALAAALQAMGAEETVLLVAATGEVNLLKSARNLPEVTALPAEGLNVYDIVRARLIVFTPAALTQLGEVRK